MNTQQIPADEVSADKNKNTENAKNKMPRKIIIAIIIVASVVLLIGLAIGGYFAWKKLEWSKAASLKAKILEDIGGTLEKITESATKGVLPPIQINPLDNEPNLNPVDKANPFKNIKTNPFE